MLACLRQLDALHRGDTPARTNMTGGRVIATLRPYMSQPNPVSTVSSPTELDIKSILLLDDDEQLSETLKALLEAHNFVVTLARNGVEGVREVMAMDFDVVICDMLMPQMPGDMFYL